MTDLEGGPALADMGAVLEVVADDGDVGLIRVAELVHCPAALSVLLPRVRRVLNPVRQAKQMIDAAASAAMTTETPA